MITVPMKVSALRQTVPMKVGAAYNAIDGVRDYNQLQNRPILNGVVIEGEKVSEDYKLTMSVQDIEKILYLGRL